MRDSFTRTLLLGLIALTVVVELPAENRVTWQSVKGASHYWVEVRRDGNLVLQTRSDSAGLPLFLPPGDYEFRVQAIDIFGEVASSSPWSPVQVQTFINPFIVDFSPNEIHIGEEISFSMHVVGSVVTPEDSSRFYLENAEGQQLLLETRFSEEEDPTSPSRLVVGVFDERIEEGDWSVVMVNPNGQENRMDAALSVVQKSTLRILHLHHPPSMHVGKKYKVTLISTGMEENAHVVFQGSSSVSSKELKSVGEGVTEYRLDLRESTSGWYSVTLSNPSGESDTLDRAFEALPPKPKRTPVDDAVQESGKEPRPKRKYPHAVYGGYGMSFEMVNSPNYLDQDFLVFSVGLSRISYNKAIRRLPAWDGFGWDITFLYSRHRHAVLQSIAVNRLQLFSGLHYVSPFDFPVNLLIRTGLGVSYSLYSSPDISRSTNLGGITLQNYDSVNLAFRAGAGFRFEITPRVFIDLICMVSGTFYPTQLVWVLQPLLEGGWRW